ncbi:NADP-dependent oxidoreductase [Rhodococcoides kyotonense]|uniref:NADPH:quinone reductase n=1 Tax=Rhodococcoides kyotonense TaxID=398843 RepID=A0A239MD85_9NOCA|nr:NADP-dependent oxidoreductase [Rhodococcus kyotonensis]SNT40450.1 NADPH:quinone reductase [Rhodococcus kyotonensis]
MFAVQYQTYGEPSVLEIADRPEPHAGPDSVRVRVLAVSVNPIDRLLRAGHLKELLPLQLPAIPGRDAVGIVDEVGEGVTDVAIGDKVFGLGGVSDTTAEYAVLTAWAPVPTVWSDEEAAAAGLASVTALRALDALGELDGSTLLVGGAAGAVGSAAAAFAIAAGVRVVGTASETNHERLRAMKVIPVTYGDGLVDRVRAAAPDGVDFALDAAGSGSLPQLIELAGDTAHVVTVADHQAASELGVRSVYAENDSALLRRAAAFADAGQYTPHVSEVMSFRDAARAHAQSEKRSGKIVLRIGLDR